MTRYISQIIILVLMFIGLIYFAPKNDVTKSVIYQKDYLSLEKELKYARITIPNRWVDPKTGELNENGSKTVKFINDKDTLIKIVKAFDRLLIKQPIDYKGEVKQDYVLTMWREGSSVSYVYAQTKDGYFFKNPPWHEDRYTLNKMPGSLVELIQ